MGSAPDAPTLRKMGYRERSGGREQGNNLDNFLVSRLNTPTKALSAAGWSSDEVYVPHKKSSGRVSREAAFS
jgi:hypothetical protein